MASRDAALGMICPSRRSQRKESSNKTRTKVEAAAGRELGTRGNPEATPLDFEEEARESAVADPERDPPRGFT